MAVSGIHADASSSHNGSGREMYYTKGSIEAVLERCKFYYVNDDSTPALDASTRSVILGKATAAAARGLRVIAMAYGHGAVEPVQSAGQRSKSSTRNPSPAPPSPSSTSPESTSGNGGLKTNLVFVGFQAMLDPPRKGVADSIALLQSGGVQVVMITGDAEETALSIARQLGLKVGGAIPGGGSPTAPRFPRGSVDNSRYCLTGKAIDQMSKAQLKERVAGISVFARTTPRHKMAIVEALQARGQVVAMTGDGGETLYA